MRIKSLLIVLLALVLFAGCGYKPASAYAKREVSGNVYVDLKVNIEDPKNSVLIKDAMNELLVHRLNARLVDKKELADTIMTVKLNSVSMQELQYDESGYIKLYKAIANINVQYENARRKNNFNVSGVYDFSIDSGGTISEAKRFDAIKNAASKALDEVISKLAIASFK